MMKAVYCVTRKDLPTIHQAVQAGHACLKAGSRFFASDYDNMYLIYLHAENKEDMMDIMKLLDEDNIEYECFYEPDYNRGLTSFATEPLEMNCSEALCKLELMEF